MNAMICDKCQYVYIDFDPKQRSKNGVLIPLERRTGKPHDCDFSEPFPCKNCGQQIYRDRKILSPTGRRIPLNHGLDTYHFCTKEHRT